MKQKVYINGIGAVTAQGIWRDELFEEAQEITNNISYALQPGYKELIAPAMIRRMSKGIKMGIYASQQALNDAEIEQPDAIITGTGLGCLEDSEKFLKAIIANEEQFLTPTNFIQSTHNTVGAQIALRLGCKGYNFTYVNGAVSFESALLDASLQIETKEAATILVGGMDELADHTVSLLKLIDQVKADDIQQAVKESTTTGVNTAEGAVFFTLSNASTKNTKAVVHAVDIRNVVHEEELAGWVHQFLAANNVVAASIDAVILGRNGDVQFDGYYDQMGKVFAQAAHIYYKHISGEYDTASAFGMAAAVYIIDKQDIPENICWNSIRPNEIKTTLVYNQYRGRDHSLILLQHVESS